MLAFDAMLPPIWFQLYGGPEKVDIEPWFNKTIG